MGDIIVSAIRWPLVVVTYPEVVTIDDIDRLGQKMLANYQRGLAERPFVSINDVSRLSVSTDFAKERAHLAKVVEQLYMNHPGAKMAEATVANSPAVRALIKVNVWMRRDKNSYPREIFATVEDAIAWGEKMAATPRHS